KNIYLAGYFLIFLSGVFPSDFLAFCAAVSKDQRRENTVRIDIRQLWRGRRGCGVELCRPLLQTKNLFTRRPAASLRGSGAGCWPPEVVRLPKPSRLWRNCAAPTGRRFTPICGGEAILRQRPKT